MKIQWNKVTWYSKLIAIIVFIATFYIAYKLGSIAGSARQLIIDSEQFTSSPLQNKPAYLANPCPTEGVAQAEVTLCESQADDAADKQLTILYQSLLLSIDSSSQIRKDFTASEQNWSAYRDAACKSEADAVVGGSMEDSTRYACLQNLTQQRIDYLHSIQNELSNS